jgi:hypothetical protein
MAAAVDMGEKDMAASADRAGKQLQFLIRQKDTVGKEDRVEEDMAASADRAGKQRVQRVPGLSW